LSASTTAFQLIERQLLVEQGSAFGIARFAIEQLAVGRELEDVIVTKLLA
jgi:hypothetical protein